MTVSAVAYSLPGPTASGLPVGPGVVAVDPSVIPLGTHMYVPGYGDAVAADTGSAVIGGIIDLWFPTARRRRRRGVGVRSRSRSTRLYTRRPPLSHSLRRRVRQLSQATDTPPQLSPRVLLVDDHDLFRTGLRTLLEAQGIDVVGEAETGTGALALIREVAPDVVVMDLNMPGIGGVEATRQIAMIAPLTRVLVLTISDQDADVMDAILAGACGYLLKDAAVQELMAGIRAAARASRSSRR